MGTHPCGHVIASAWLHECGMEGDSIRRVLACNAFVGKKSGAKGWCWSWNMMGGVSTAGVRTGREVLEQVLEHLRSETA